MPTSEDTVQGCPGQAGSPCPQHPRSRGLCLRLSLQAGPSSPGRTLKSEGRVLGGPQGGPPGHGLGDRGQWGGPSLTQSPTHGHADTHTKTQSHRDTQRHRDTITQRHTETKRHKDTNIHRNVNTLRHSDTHTDIQMLTYRCTHRSHRLKQTYRHCGLSGNAFTLANRQIHRHSQTHTKAHSQHSHALRGPQSAQL